MINSSTSPPLISKAMPCTSCRDQDLVLSVVEKLGRFEVTRTVCDTTTHVVCGSPRRTINILAATAMGCWVLSKNWVRATFVCLECIL